jgi:hypothetical protein
MGLAFLKKVEWVPDWEGKLRIKSPSEADKRMMEEPREG